MPSANATTIPEAETLQREGRSLLERGKALAIKTSEDFQRASAELVSVARFKKSVADKFAPAKKAAHEAHAAICKLETEVLAPAVQVERLLRSGISTYSIEQDRKRREEQARLEREERERRETEAIELADELSDPEEREAVLEEAIAAPAPVVEIPQERAAGISTRRTWKYQVSDLSKVKREFLVLDEKKVGQLVRAMGPDAIEVIGAGSIQVYEEATVIARTA